MRNRTHFLKAVLTIAILCGPPVRVTAVEPDWRNADEMRRELHTSLGITWRDRSLRDALASLATTQRVAIWLDRRIDPTLQPAFSFQNTPFQQVLLQVAERLRSGVGYVGPVVYVGPTATATKLWTISELRNEEARKLPAGVRTKWTALRPMEWAELATPRELLQMVADSAGCKLERLDVIPHDLWPAVTLPPMTLPEQLTVILAGFDMNFEIAEDGRLIRLVLLPENPLLVRDYPTRNEITRTIAEVSRNFPQARVQRVGTRIAVTGTAEDHDAISRFVRGESDRRVPAGPTITRYGINVVNKPVGAVLRELESTAQLKISIDQDAQSKLTNLVSFEVRDATLEQLLQAALRETGLTFKLQGTQLSISVAKE